MCGIAAVAGCHLDVARRAAALARMRNRGPDMEGQWEEPGLWLGHRRLSIQDLSDAGRQPMATADGRFHLVCNGEIYNAPELRDELAAKGYRFVSGSDSEVLLHGYAAWGEAVVGRLAGMFAFVLWDSQRRRLLAVRDRVGIKPLYWAPCGDGVVLASDAGALRELLGRAPRPSALAMAYVLALGYIPSPHSIWEGTHKLEAGSLLCWTAEGGVQIRSYWEPPRDLDGSDEARPWSNLFAEIVDQHLLADVELGLFLSGGIDSTAIATQLTGRTRQVQALTLDYAGHPQTEAEIAAESARHLGLRHRLVPLVDADVGVLAAQAARAFDEPQGYSAPLSMFRLCENAGGLGIKAFLSGDGGDEVFAGYSWYDNLAPLPRPRTGLRHMFGRWRKRSLEEFAALSPLHRHATRLFPRFLPEEIVRLLAPMGLSFDDEAMLAPLVKHFEPALPLRRALQRVDLRTFCTDSICAKVDRASMHHSLEIRVPLLDHRIVERGLSDPDIAASPKEVLRRYLDGRVPRSVVDHPKQGFSLRLNAFDYDGLLPLIASTPWVRDGYWAPEWKELAGAPHLYRQGRIWTLFMLGEWAKNWL